MAEWLKMSRLNGVMRYHYKTIGSLIVWTLLMVLAVQIISLATPFFTGRFYPFDGIRGNFEIVFAAAFVIGILTTGRSTRFLLRFGTSRTSVWLGNILSLLGGMAALLLATFLLNMLIGALLIPLSGLLPNGNGFSMTAAQYQYELTKGLEGLPELLLYSLEWTSIFYLYGCMLRRFRVLTITVSIAVPLFFVVLMLIPAVHEGLAVLGEENQGQIVLLGLKWLQILQDIINFFQEHWYTIQLMAGIASLPLSYLIMRGTKQP
jgi:hypothetical protein